MEVSGAAGVTFHFVRLVCLVHFWRLVAGALIQRIRKGVWTMTRNVIWCLKYGRIYPRSDAKSPNQE